MKKRRVIIAAAILCLMLSGCSGLSLSGSDILAPPKAEGELAKILELVQESAGGKKYEMVYPASGEYQSSVIFRDLDNDGEEEAVAMYSVNPKEINVLIADPSGGGYQTTAECTVPARRLSRIEFPDFNGDGMPEILLSYPGASAQRQSLTVISLKDEADQADMPNTCAAHLVGDFNADGTADLLTLALSDGKTLPMAELFVGTDSGLVRQSSCEVASEAKEYTSVKFGSITEDTQGAVIDAKCAGGDYTTQLICYDESAHGVINPLYVSSSYESTKRSVAINSADIDGDGVTEIPLCSLMDYAPNEDASSVCNRIDWSCYDYNELALTVKQSAILCDKLGFMLRLTPEHADIVTARYTEGNTATVYLWEYKRSNPERTAKLLTIRRYDKNAYNVETVYESVAGQNSSCIYTYVLDADAGSYGYTAEEVESNFFIL